MTKDLAVGPSRFHLVAVYRDGQWMAHAERAENGDPFGVDCAGSTEVEAIDRLTEWLMWQREHTEALEALQQAERAYHRIVAGSAFANPTEGPTPFELQRESLDALEAARVRLEEVRARKPE